MQPNANLSVVRGPSAWIDAESRANVTPRLMLGGAGLGLMLAAARRHRPGRAILACGGASLVGLAVSGHAYAQVNDWLRQQLDAWRARDEVNEGSEMSFPASDSPSWMGSGSINTQDPHC